MSSESRHTIQSTSVSMLSCSASTDICEHRIIEDLIDISPDSSKYIYYCEKCYECFSNIKGNTNTTCYNGSR